MGAQDLVMRFIGYDLISRVVGGIQGSIRNLINDAKKGDSEVGKALGNFAGPAMVAGGALLGVAAIMGAVAVSSVKMAAEFDKQMTLMVTQAGLPAAAMGVLKQKILDNASSLGISATEMAKATFHIVSLTSGTKDAAHAFDIAKIAIQGATVGNADYEETATALGATVASGIRGAQNYGQAMGAINAIIGQGNMRMGDYNNAMKSGLVPIMRGAGVDIVSMGASLARLTDIYGNAGVAANRLKTLIGMMQSPSAIATDAMKQMGMTHLQLANDMRSPGGLTTAIEDLHNHLNAFTTDPSMQADIIGKMFGRSRSMGGMVSLIQQLDEVKGKQAAIAAGAGSFGQAWEATTETTAFKMQRLNATVDNLRIAVGEALEPAFRKILDVVTPIGEKLIEWVNTNSALIGKFAPIVIAVTAVVGAVLTLSGIFAVVALAAGPLIGVIGGVATVVVELVSQIGIAVAVGGGFGAVFEAIVAVLGGPFTIAIVGVIAVAGFLELKFHAVTKAVSFLVTAFKTVVDIFNIVSGGIRTGAGSADILEQVLLRLGFRGNDLYNLFQALHPILANVVNGFVAMRDAVSQFLGPLGPLQAAARGVWDVLANLLFPVTVVLFQAFWAIATTALPPLWTAFMAIGGAVVSLFGAIFGLIGSLFGLVGPASGAQQKTNDLAGATRDASGHAQTFVEKVQALAQKFKDFMVSPGVVNFMTWLAVDFPAQILMAAAYIVIMIDHITKMVHDMTGMVKILGDVMRGDWGAVWKDSKDYVQQAKDDNTRIFADQGKLMDAIQEASGQKILDKQNAFKDKYLASVLGLKNDSTTTLQQQVNEHEQMLSRHADAVVGHSIIPDMVNSVVRWFGTMRDNSRAPISDMTSSMASAFNGLSTSAGSALDGLATTISSKLQGMVSSVQRDASALGRGITDGIKGAMGSIGGALSGIVNDGLSAAKKAAGISSPSTLFASQLGAPLGAGVVMGIASQAAAAKKAVAALINEAKDQGTDKAILLQIENLQRSQSINQQEYAVAVEHKRRMQALSEQDFATKLVNAKTRAQDDIARAINRGHADVAALRQQQYNDEVAALTRTHAIEIARFNAVMASMQQRHDLIQQSYANRIMTLERSLANKEGTEARILGINNTGGNTVFTTIGAAGGDVGTATATSGGAVSGTADSNLITLVAIQSLLQKLVDGTLMEAAQTDLLRDIEEGIDQMAARGTGSNRIGLAAAQRRSG